MLDITIKCTKNVYPMIYKIDLFLNFTITLYFDFFFHCFKV